MKYCTDHMQNSVRGNLFYDDHVKIKWISVGLNPESAE